MANKKILIHCSTNNGSTNFGDVLFAYMIQKHLQDRGIESGFYDLSQYNQNYLYNIHGLQKYNIDIADADGVIYFAGGYFGEKKGARIDTSYRHYKRFMRFGKEALSKGKPIAVIGIGAGDYLWFPSRLIVKDVCNSSQFVTTRDKESTQYLRRIGITSSIITCSDIAQTINVDNFIVTEKLILDNQYEYIFLHTNYQKDVAELFCSGVKEYVLSHQNIKLIVGSDNIVNTDEAYEIVRKKFGNDRVIKYEYTYPENLIHILSKCKLVITYKLHVGILSATLGTSVIAAAKHEKVFRYYRQINESNRCVNFKNCNQDILANLVLTYYGKRIDIGNNMFLAYENWNMLDRFIDSIVHS